MFHGDLICQSILFSDIQPQSDSTFLLMVSGQCWMRFCVILHVCRGMHDTVSEKIGCEFVAICVHAHSACFACDAAVFDMLEHHCRWSCRQQARQSAT